MFSKSHIALSVFLILFAALIAACGGTAIAAPVDPTEPAVNFPAQDIVQPALVESAEVRILESFPVQVQVEVTGLLSNGCAALTEPVQVNGDDNTITITLNESYPADAACTLAMVPFTEVISVDVLGLPAGDYVVVVNNFGAGFSLAVDNSPITE